MFSFREAIFWFMGVIGAIIYKFLAWLMPKTYQLFADHIRGEITKNLVEEVKNLTEKVETLSKELTSYRREKHNKDGELKECVDAIVSDDKEKLNVLKAHYEKKSA